MSDSEKRLIGVTTRLADKYIQELFKDMKKESEVVTADHRDCVDCHKKLFGILLNRLKTEHQVKIESDIETLKIKYIPW